MLILIGCATGGIALGLIRFFFACLSLTLGVYLARSFYLPVAEGLSELFEKLPPHFSRPVACFIIFFFSTIVIFQLGLGLLKIMQNMKVRWLDRLLGGVLMLVIGWGASGFMIRLLELWDRPVVQKIVRESMSWMSGTIGGRDIEKNGSS